jgi:WD40 repeat protein
MFLSGSDNLADLVGDDTSMYYDTSQQSNLTEEDTSNYHKDIITRVLRIDKPYQYLTASKDGTVRTWNANTLSLQSVFATGRDWITDCTIMQRSHRLAIASMNRTLSFYDLNSGLLIGEIQEFSKKQATPLCLEYVEKPADDREALVIGDDYGVISIITCSDQWLSCDGRNSSSTSATSGGASGNGSNATSLETQGFSSREKFKKHTDWITRVKWVNDIRAIVATSLDSDISVAFSAASTCDQVVNTISMCIIYMCVDY